MRQAYDQLVSDHAIVPALATRLLHNGYYAIPCGGKSASGNPGKVWLEGAEGFRPYEPADDQLNPPDADKVIDLFQSYPGCGISIAVPWLRNSSSNLLCIDLDVDDPDTLRAIARIIGIPCPVRTGQKGAAFVVRYPALKSIPDILKERGVPVPKWAKPSGLGLPVLGVAKGIDLLGLKIGHFLIPPTLHLKKTRDQGSPAYYEWVPFPETETVLTLEDTPIGDLPELEPWHLLLLFQWAKNPRSAIWKYIGESGPGDHHNLMLAASTYMWNEKFTQDEIQAICEREGDRSAESDQVSRDRAKEISTAVHTLPRRMPEQAPAAAPRGPRGVKVPRDREIYDFLVTKYPEDDVGFFAMTPYHWTGEEWRRITDPTHSEPWAELYNMLIRTFNDVNNGIASSALKAFTNHIPTRQAAPDIHLIPFANGLLDVTTGTLRRPERDDYILSSLPHIYNPQAECPLWDTFLKHLLMPPMEFLERDTYNDDHAKSIQCVEEFFGYCLTKSHSFQKMLYVIGRPGTGKSVLFKVMRALMPREWTSTVSLENFDDPNSLIQMASAHVNVSGEVGRRSRDVDDTLLKVTAGEEVAVKLLYVNKAQAILPTRLIFQGNLIPDTTDATGAIQRRMMMIRTTDIVPTQVPLYEAKLIREAEGILARLAAAYKRLLDRGYFDLPAYSIEIAENVTRESNSAAKWLHDCTTPALIKNEETQSSDLYDHYVEWCMRNGMYKYSVVQWGKLVTAYGFPTKTQRAAGGNFLNVRTIKLLGMRKVSY